MTRPLLRSLTIGDLQKEYKAELDKARQAIRAATGFKTLEKAFIKISEYNRKTRSSDYWVSIDDPIRMLDGLHYLDSHAGLKAKCTRETIRSITVTESEKAKVARQKILAKLHIEDKGDIIWQLAEKFTDQSS